VRDALLVQVDECTQELLHDIGCLLFIQVLLLENVVEQFAARAVFKDEEAHALPFPHLVELDDVRVVL